MADSQLTAGPNYPPGVENNFCIKRLSQINAGSNIVFLVAKKYSMHNRSLPKHKQIILNKLERDLFNYGVSFRGCCMEWL